VLLTTAALTAGCGGTGSSHQRAASTPPHEHKAKSLPNEQDALVKLAKSHGRAWVEASRNLPDQVETR
jgi:hypothetical protein